MQRFKIERTTEMNPYKKSNYAINKVRKGIVYRNADNSILEITFEKIAEENPNFTVEDFEKLKHLSDELYHEEAKNDWKFHHHITSDLNDNLSSNWISFLVSDEESMNRSNENLFYEKLKEVIDTILTPTQNRRFKMFAFEGLTYREIAQMENVNIRAVWESVELSKKKIQKFIKNF